jgi:hypothetical protein
MYDLQITYTKSLLNCKNETKKLKLFLMEEILYDSIMFISEDIEKGILYLPETIDDV